TAGAGSRRRGQPARLAPGHRASPDRPRLDGDAPAQAAARRRGPGRGGPGGGQRRDPAPGGDEVFGGGMGVFADYARAKEGELAPKPHSLSFEEAAAVPLAAITALQALRDHGRLQAGQAVLINGASGGVGLFAVQIAKHLGAEVTGVCSAGNVELVRSMGADHFVDYAAQDFTCAGRRYDLILDNAGNHPLKALRRAITRRGTLISNSGSGEGRWLGPLGRIAKVKAAAPFVSQRLVFFMARVNRADLGQL